MPQAIAGHIEGGGSGVAIFSLSAAAYVTSSQQHKGGLRQLRVDGGHPWPRAGDAPQPPSSLFFLKPSGERRNVSIGAKIQIRDPKGSVIMPSDVNEDGVIMGEIAEAAAEPWWILEDPQEPKACGTLQPQALIRIRHPDGRYIVASTVQGEKENPDSAKFEMRLSKTTPVPLLTLNVDALKVRSKPHLQSLFKIILAERPPISETLTRLMASSHSLASQARRTRQHIQTEEDLEMFITEDLLFALMGVDSDIIEVKATRHPSRPAAFRAITHLQDTGAGPALVKLVESISKVIESHRAVADFVRTKFEPFVNRGLTHCAFREATGSLIRDFEARVLKMEDVFRSNPLQLSLQKLWLSLQPARVTFDFLAQLLADVDGKEGSQLINHLYGQLLDHSKTDSNRKICEFLLEKTGAPIAAKVNRWLERGEILSEFSTEFFIVDEVKELAPRPLDPTGSRFRVKESDVPEYLQPVADKILQTGRYLNALRLSQGTLHLPDFVPLPSFSDDERAYAAAVDQRFSQASSALLDHVIRDLDLTGRLLSLKNYFLLHKSDFFHHFLEQVAGDLEKANVIVPKLQSILEMSMRTSSCVSDSYKDELSCGMSTLQLHDLCRLFDPSWQRTSGALSEEALKQASGWQKAEKAGSDEALKFFTFKFAAKWPLDMIITPICMLKYQMLFRLLLQFKFVEQRLSEVWQDHMLTKEFAGAGDEAGAHFALSHFTRQRMIHFCRNFVYYVTLEVIEPQSAEFFAALSSSRTLDEIVELHENFLDSCLKECLLTEAELFRSLSKVLTVCQLFARHALKFSLYGNTTSTLNSSSASQEAGSVEARQQRLQNASAHFERLVKHSKFRNMMNEFSKHFDRNLLAFLKDLISRSRTRFEHHLLNLLTRLDYNLFYSRHFKMQISPSMGSAR